MRRSTRACGLHAAATSPNGRCSTNPNREMPVMRKILIGLLACLPIAAAAEQPVKLKFATFSPDTERLYKPGKKPWVAAGNKASRGAIQIERYPDGPLGRAPQRQA